MSYIWTEKKINITDTKYQVFGHFYTMLPSVSSVLILVKISPLTKSFKPFFQKQFEKTGQNCLIETAPVK